MNIIGGTVEDLGKKAIRGGNKFKTHRQLVEDFIENMILSVNMLINMGHVNAWEYTYEEYKAACRHSKKFEQIQVMTFATAISLVFGGKQAIRNYLKDEKT